MSLVCDLYSVSYPSRSDCLIYYCCVHANTRIGIRSEDLKDTLDKTLGGSLFVLSSPRLIIPAVIFGLSTFSSHFENSIFNFEVKYIPLSL